MNQEEIIALLRLQKTPNIGDITAKKLIAHFGSAHAIFKEKQQNFEKISGIGKVISSHLFNPNYQTLAQKEWDFICQNNINFCSFTDSNYPKNLLQAIDGPILFFYKGNINWDNKKIISIVGTREATPYGRDFCENFIKELSSVKKDIIIVSGFAYGIDIIAHRAAMANNIQTIACLAHGLDMIYPSYHKKYYSSMLINGGFITDFGHHCKFDRKNFLKRNRIIAGLADTTIVVESAKKGGSLVTADIAFSYNREVFAVPGRLSDPYSEGCNLLINNNKAHIFTSTSDFISQMNWQIKKEEQNNSPKISLEGDEKIIYDYLNKQGKKQLDEISRDTKITISQLSNILFILEMKGIIYSFPGKFFSIFKSGLK